MSNSFYLLWISYLLSEAGNWIYKIALPLVIYDLTGSSFYMATLYGIEYLPWLLFSIFGGYLADRFNKKYLLVLGNFFDFLFLSGLTILLSLSQLHLFYIYVLAFLLSSIDPLIHPTFHSIIPQFVKPDYLVKANSSIQFIGNTITFLGPMIGGATISAIGGKNSLYLVMALFLLAGVNLLLIKFNSEQVKSSRSGMIGEIWEGIRYTINNKVILSGVFFFFFTNMATSAFQGNLIYYLKDYLKLGAKMVGITIGLQGIGPILAAVITPYLNKKFPPGRLIVYSTCLSGFFTIFLLGATSFWQVALIQAISMGCGTLTTITFFSLRQSIVPPELLGRVAGLNRMIGYSAIPFSSFIAGWILQLGFPFYFLILFSSCLRLFTGIVGFFIPLNRGEFTKRTSQVMNG